jgi:hypothetical protein
VQTLLAIALTMIGIGVALFVISRPRARHGHPTH